jgi:ABC-2 type transport system ATP-binding protein
MDDIIDLCDRVIILDEGVILYDGPVSTVKRKFGDVRHITFSSSVDFDPSVLSNNFGDLVEITKPNGNFKVSFDISKISINQVLSVILKSAQITDINISENSLESIVKQIYETKKY